MIKYLAFILSFLLSFSSFARWATESDLSYLLLKNNSNITVKEDGSSFEVNEQFYELLTEGAKKDFSIFKINYDAGKSKVKIKNLTVINGTEKYDYDPNKVTDKAIDTGREGFDSTKQVSVALPNLKKGSIIKLVFEKENFVGPINGAYGLTLNYGSQVYEKESNVSIISKKKLHYKEVDPEKVLSISQEVTSEGHKLNIKLKRPHLRKIVGEQGYYPKEFITKISISSLDSWEAFSKQMTPIYEKKVTDKLPSKLNDILNLVKKEEGVGNQVDKLLASITKSFNYVGDWRSVKGSFYPRSIEEISKSGFGDCKDFSLLTVSLLRKLGYDANFALVFRGEADQPRFVVKDIPTVGYFNHAIVHLKHDDKPYWIDATNPSSFGLSYRTDISNKYALVLNETTKNLTYIPYVKSTNNEVKTSKVYDFVKTDVAKVSGEYKLSGEVVLQVKNLVNNLPSESRVNAYERIVTQSDKSSFFEYKDGYKPNSDSWSYEDIDLRYNYRTKFTKDSSKGVYFSVPDSTYARMAAAPREESVSYLSLGDRVKVNRSTTLKNVKLLSEPPLRCEIDNKWVKASRDYKISGSDINILDKVNIKETLVSPNEFGDKAFTDFQYEFYDCFVGQELNIAQANDNNFESLADKNKNFEKLSKEEIHSWAYKIVMESGYKKDYDYTPYDAIKMLELQLKRTPKSAETYRLLSLVIANTYRDSETYQIEALGYAKKAIDLEPTNPLHYIKVAYILKTNGKNGEANEYIRKATELDQQGIFEVREFELESYVKKRKISEYEFETFFLERILPTARNDYLKRRAYIEAANFFSRRKNYYKWEEYVKKGMSYTPNFAWGYYNAGLTFFKIKNYEKAVEWYEKAVSLMDFSRARYNLSKTYIKMAESHSRLSEIDKAMEKYILSIDNYPLPEAHIGIAKIYTKRNKFEKAISEYKNALEFSDTNRSKVNFFISSLLLKLNKPKEAINLFEKAIQSEKSSAQQIQYYVYILDIISEKLKDQKQFESVYNIASQVVEKGPSDTNEAELFYLSAGRVHMKYLTYIGGTIAYTKSNYFYDKAIALNPDSPAKVEKDVVERNKKNKREIASVKEVEIVEKAPIKEKSLEDKPVKIEKKSVDKLIPSENRSIITYSLLGFVGITVLFGIFKSKKSKKPKRAPLKRPRRARQGQTRTRRVVRKKASE
jgi:tetratricopeptide (TPR) repeat protein